MKFKHVYDRYESGSVRYAEKFLVEKQWLKAFKAYIKYKEVKSYRFERKEYLASLSVEHLDKAHPGPIPND